MESISLSEAASVVFTAHNRRDMVLQAISLAKSQTVPLEIIVADDASSDGTRDAVLAAHPEIIYLRSEESRGACYQRNRGVEAASGEFVFLLDDDSMLISPKTIEQSLRQFTTANEAGIVAMPFVNVLQDNIVRNSTSDMQLFDYVACAHAVRKSAFLEVGGYCEVLFYMVEETDLALRMYEFGYNTIVVDCDPVHHLQPPARRSYKADFYGRRNSLLLQYMRAPAGYLGCGILRSIAQGLWFGIRTARLRAAFHGPIAAFADIARGAVVRNPVSCETFSAYLTSRAR
jgi:glycosyltransferase involved in cell wall biosynthesis